MKTNVEKLNGLNKLSPDELDAAKKILAAKQARSSIAENTKTVFRYGTEYTKREQDALKQTFNDPDKKKIAQELVKGEVKGMVELLSKLKVNYLTLSERVEWVLEQDAKIRVSHLHFLGKKDGHMIISNKNLDKMIKEANHRSEERRVGKEC